MLFSTAPRGVRGALYPLYLLVFLLCVVGTEGHGGSNIKEGDHCVPWLCSCFYRGVYYDKGDVWSDVDDPCVKYQCQYNGYFEAIESGCSFKGECKDRGSRWSEGCIQYTCPASLIVKGYRLLQAACAWKDGNCYAVGERALEGCDVYECQIDHGCYVMNLVKSGCHVADPNSVKGVCKPVFSFWQDECAMYQCTGEDKSSLKARVLIHSHDVMAWPRGHYALPEPKDKCPDLEKGIWMEGSHIHCGDGRNFNSRPFNLLGIFNETVFQHTFCVHHDVDDPEHIPLYQTYWEPGRYCLLRYNGTCPKDFTEGYLEMTNSQCFPNETIESSILAGLNVTDGRLPDGNFTLERTRIEFCCRYDGEIERAIILPAKHPFVLFMAENETECQSVQGMRVEKEFWSFSDAADGMFRILNGSLPLIKTGDNNTLVNYCYYSPLGCGCTDDEEDVYAVGENKTDQCVTSQCRNIENYHVMVVTKGGCWDEVHERCREENATWDDTRGEMCLERKCVRITQPDDHLNVTFEIIDLKKGCRDGAECRPLNYTKEKGCYASQCQLDVSDEASFVLIRSGCSIGGGICIPHGANHTAGCVTLGCDKTKSRCGLHVIEAGCRGLNDTCVAVDDVMTHACMNWTCKEEKRDGKLSWKLVPLSPACADRSGNCYEEGDTLNSGCVTYECVFGDRPGFYPVSQGCGVKLNGKTVCIYLNKSIDYHCHKLKCVEKDGKNALLKEPGCSANGKCYKEGETYVVQDKCLTYKCQKTGRMAVEGAGCKYEGTCYPANENFTVGCNTFKCHFNGTKIWITHVQSACKVDGKCLDPGTIFKHKCHTLKCSEDKKSCRSELVEYGCKNESTGECLEPGTEIKKGCSVSVCQPDGKKNPYVLKSTGCNYQGTCYPANKNFTIGCDTFMCHHNGTKVWATHLQKACKVDGKCIDPGTIFKHKCHTYKCSEDKKSCRSDLIEYGCKNETTGECIEPGTEIMKGCSKYVCQPDGLKTPYKLVSAGCSYKEKCYSSEKLFKIGCYTYNCTITGNKQTVKRVEVACKVDGKCIPPGTVYKRQCHTLKCSDDKLSCHSELVEYGCQDDVSEECVEEGGEVRRGCGVFTCKPDGKNNPYVFKSGACPYNDSCLPVGEARTDADCKAVKCVLRDPSKPSLGIGMYKTTGCVENGQCIPFGKERVSMTHAYYCITLKCHAGKFYKIKHQCKDMNNKCVEKTATGTPFQLKHGGKVCTGFCSNTGIKIKC